MNQEGGSRRGVDTLAESLYFVTTSISGDHVLTQHFRFPTWASRGNRIRIGCGFRQRQEERVNPPRRILKVVRSKKPKRRMKQM